MVVYGKERFHKAHSQEHPYASYDLTTRDVICANCGKIIGEQIRWEVYEDRQFSFYDEREKDDYKYCPYCGELLYPTTLPQSSMYIIDSINMKGVKVDGNS